MKKSVKFAVVLLVFLLGLSGCGLDVKNDDAGTGTIDVLENSESVSTNEVTTQFKSAYSYAADPILRDVQCNRDSMMAADEEMVYFVEVTTDYNSDNDSVVVTYRLLAQRIGEDQITELYQCQEKNWRVGEKILALEACEDGIVAFLTQVSNEQGQTYYLKRMDTRGMLLEDIQLEETAVPLGMLLETREGLAWCDSTAGIVIYGKENHDWVKFGEDKAQQYMEIGTLKNQTLWAKIRIGESPYSWELMSWDREHSDWIKIDIPFSEEVYNNVTSGKLCGYDFLLWNNVSVAGWNVGDAMVTTLIDFIASGIDFDQIRQLIPLSETQYLARMDVVDESGQVSLLTESEYSATAEKTVLELAYLGDDSILPEIRRFNQENKTTMIVLRDYTQYGDDKVSRLTLDVGTGNAPDIFVTTAIPSVRDLITAGAFEDLYQWLAQDEELDKDDFLENILRAYEVNGSLYEMPLAFYLDMYAAKEKIVGEVENVSFDELQRLAEKYPDSSVLSTFAGQQDFLREIIASGQFYDLYAGECYFDSDQFIETLKFLNTLPSEHNWEGKDWPYTRTDEVLITGVSLNTFESFQWKEEYSYGEKTCFFALGNQSKGLIRGSGKRFAISSQSEYKDEAWEFLRYFWGEEYQNSVADSKSNPAFPVRISALEYMKEKAMKQETGSAETYYWDGKEQVVPVMTKEQVERYSEYLYRADTRYMLNYDIYNIVIEETEGYFTGQFTAEKVADAIQRRVRLYLWERQ